MSKASRRYPQIKLIAGACAAALILQNEEFSNSCRKNKFLSPSFRIGLTLLTTASLCIDYKFQELINNVDLKECHERSAKKLGLLCAKNGGLYIKSAQYLASMDHLLPDIYIKTLSLLQDKAPVSSLKIVEKIFQDELGIGLDEVFSEIRETPIGSASIGQVHFARLRKTGEQVAVKVQHPNIKMESEIDLWSFKLSLKLIKFIFPSIDLNWMIEELRDCLVSELNFLSEAQNSESARMAFSKNPKINKIVRIPKIFYEHSTERILIMEFVSGIKLNDKQGLEASAVDTNKVIKFIYEIFMEMIFNQNFTHCDPHPGNILIEKDKISGDLRIILLDHGLYKAIHPEIVSIFSHLFLAILDQDDLKIQKIADDLKVSGTILGDFKRFIKTMNKSVKQNKGSAEKVQREMSNFLLNRSEHSKKEASEVLKALPRELLFLLKILDLLKANERCLNSNVDDRIPQSLLIVTDYCLKYISQENRDYRIHPMTEIFGTIKLYWSLLKLYMQSDK